MSSAAQHLDPEVLLSKAVINETNLPNSVLNRQQADRFLDLVVDYSILLKRVRRVRVNNAKGVINKLDLGSIVTEGASATTTASARIPTESTVNWDTIKYRSAFDLKTDFIEDNLEGDNIRDRLLNMFTKRIAVDAEVASIEGDASLTTGDAQSDSNNLLGVNDGFIELFSDSVPAGNKLAAAGTASSFKMFYDMKRKIPSRYRVAKPDYRFVVPSSVYDKWTYDTAARATTGGDKARESANGATPLGTQMVEVPLIPEDLTYGSNSDATTLWLTPLQNLIWFVQRDITIEWDRVPRSDQWEVTIHFRQDVQVENCAMVVTATGVREDGSDYA